MKEETEFDNSFPEGAFAGSVGESIESRVNTLERRMNLHRHTTADRTQPLGGAAAGVFTVQQTWHNTAPQTAMNFYGGIWIAPVECTVTAIYERHEDNASSACSIWVRKNGSTELLSSAFDMTRNAGMTNSGTLTSSVSNLTFAIGDRLNVAISASVGGLTGVNIIVAFQPT